MLTSPFRKRRHRRSCLLFIATSCLAQAGYLEDIGLPDLRARDPSLNGAGETVAQVEAQQKDTDNWQTDPANVGLPADRFTYYSTAFAYPEGGDFDSSRESGHANTVGGRYFAVPSGTDGKDGVAPGVDTIQVFEAGYYYNSLISLDTDTGASVVNQSFVFNSQDNAVDRNYDDLAASRNILYCNGINTNQTPATIPSPASMFNGITVGAIDRATDPLSDGRSKPDIVAPGSSASSFTTPLVAGAAALLFQSAKRGDAGAGTEADASVWK